MFVYQPFKHATIDYNTTVTAKMYSIKFYTFTASILGIILINAVVLLIICMWFISVNAHYFNYDII